jgi:hypothetical protein
MITMDLAVTKRARNGAAERRILPTTKKKLAPTRNSRAVLVG